jgi:hypothetical protein
MTTISSLLWFHSSDGGSVPLLLCHSSNRPADVSRARYYNRFLNKKYNLLDLIMEHPCPTDYSMWGPHMHARRLHHRIRPPQSTSTISSGHRTLEHRHPPACTASLITAIETVAWTHALPPQHACVVTRTHARGLVSV